METRAIYNSDVKIRDESLRVCWPGQNMVNLLIFYREFKINITSCFFGK